ncbi:MAG: protein kinase [Acidobacteriota bacterium]
MLGQRLAHYQITKKIGEGGMGVVYQATDTKLGRQVALKVLPPSVANDPERLARFEREARTLASLNHPNIASIYGVEEGALVMEMVEGPTLADHIRGRALPDDEAIAIALQIADALAAAHEKNIIHRDLKPANVKLTPEGAVKLLDFGLAKALEADPSSNDPESSPTITMNASLTGVIMGTAGYMSPEQARGLKVDRRADIWAFGVVLYEMVTGQSLFSGETVADKLAGVLTKELDLHRAPVRFQPLLRQCLQRDPRKRLGWIGDVRFLLEAPPVESTARPSRWPLLALAAALLASLAALAFVLARRPASEERPVRRFSLASPNLTSAFAAHVQISPDGKHIAYVDSNRLWVRDFDREEPRLLVAAGTMQGPVWSPDSLQIAYYGGADLWRTSAATASPVKICNVSGGYFGAAWSPDGASIAFTSSFGLFAVPASGGQPKLVLPRGDRGASIRSPYYLPSEFGPAWVLVSAGKPNQEQILAFNLTSGEQHALGKGRFPVYSPDGYVIFQRDNQLWAASYSVAKRHSLGDPFPLAIVGGFASVSRDGTLVVVDRQDAIPTRLVIRDRSGKLVRTVGDTLTTMRYLALSPDRKRAAVSSMESGSPDIWIQDLEHGLKSRLTFDSGLESYPRFTLDGKGVAYASTRGASADILLQPADGSGEATVIMGGPDGEFPTDWSPDGRYLIATIINAKGTRDVWIAERNPSGGWKSPVPFEATEFDETGGRVSPNGRFILYRSNEGGESTVYARPFPTGPGRWQVAAGAAQPRWSVDGNEIFYLIGDVLMAAHVSTANGFSMGGAQRLFPTGYFETSDISRKYEPMPNGQFLLTEPIDESSNRAQEIHIVENWLKAFHPATTP